MKNYQNPNLWSVNYSVRGVAAMDQILVCGSTASVATTKANRVLKRNGIRGAQIVKVEHEGAIDAF